MKQQNVLIIVLLWTLPHTCCVDQSPQASTRYTEAD